MPGFCVPVDDEGLGSTDQGLPKDDSPEEPALKKTFWCHAMCGSYHEKLYYAEPPAAPFESINLSNVVMASQKEGDRSLKVIEAKKRCTLCGRTDYLKHKCNQKLVDGSSRSCTRLMHLGCARQAGFDVTPTLRYEGEDRFGERDGVVSGNVACLEHSTGEDFGLRDRIQALMSLEAASSKRQKLGPKKFSGECFHAACRVIQCLSWAWRWADWWVGHGACMPVVDKIVAQKMMVKKVKKPKKPVPVEAPDMSSTSGRKRKKTAKLIEESESETEEEIVVMGPSKLVRIVHDDEVPDRNMEQRR